MAGFGKCGCSNAKDILLATKSIGPIQKCGFPEFIECDYNSATGIGSKRNVTFLAKVWTIDKDIGICVRQINKNDLVIELGGAFDGVRYRAKVSFDALLETSRPSTDVSKWEIYSGSSIPTFGYVTGWTRQNKYAPLNINVGDYVSGTFGYNTYDFICDYPINSYTSLTEEQTLAYSFYDLFKDTGFNHLENLSTQNFTLIDPFAGRAYLFVFSESGPTVSSFTMDGVTVNKMSGPVRYKTIDVKTVVTYSMQGAPIERTSKHRVNLPSFDPYPTFIDYGVSIDESGCSPWGSLVLPDPGDDEYGIRRVTHYPTYHYWTFPNVSVSKIANLYASKTRQTLKMSFEQVHYYSFNIKKYFLAEYTKTNYLSWNGNNSYPGPNEAYTVRRDDGASFGFQNPSSVHNEYAQSWQFFYAHPDDEWLSWNVIGFYWKGIYEGINHGFNLVGNQWDNSPRLEGFSFRMAALTETTVSDSIGGTIPIFIPDGTLGSNQISDIRETTTDSFYLTPFNLIMVKSVGGDCTGIMTSSLSGDPGFVTGKCLIMPLLSNDMTFPSGLERTVYVANYVATSGTRHFLFYLTKPYSETKIEFDCDLLTFIPLAGLDELEYEDGTKLLNNAETIPFDVEHIAELSDEFTDDEYRTMCGDMAYYTQTPQCTNAAPITTPYIFNPLKHEKTKDTFISLISPVFGNFETQLTTATVGKLCWTNQPGCIKIIDSDAVTCDDWDSSDPRKSIELDPRWSAPTVYKINGNCAC